MAALPNGAAARVDIAKISGYLLNPGHPVGRHKARVFRAALGLTAEHAALLQSALRTAAASQDASLERQDRFGDQYTVHFELAHEGRVREIRSLWIVRSGENFPRFVSAFVVD